MSKVSEAAPGSLDDVVIACSEEELEALREVARRADGRRSETRLAREVLGIES